MPENLPFTSDADIARIGNGLLARTLPRPEWTHAAHVAVALWLLSGWPGKDVPREMPAVIRAYNVATGGRQDAERGTRPIRWHRSARRGRILLASPMGDPDWLLAYWSCPLLFSPYARLNECEPDIRTLRS